MVKWVNKPPKLKGLLVVNPKPADAQSYSTSFVCFRNLEALCSNGISSTKQFREEKCYERIRTEAKV